jgi:hypothetical protein
LLLGIAICCAAKESGSGVSLHQGAQAPENFSTIREYFNETWSENQVAEKLSSIKDRKL